MYHSSNGLGAQFNAHHIINNNSLATSKTKVASFEEWACGSSFTKLQNMSYIIIICMYVCIRLYYYARRHFEAELLKTQTIYTALHYFAM